MTEAEVLALINAAIVANGNNEITANVLRPILVAMLEQPNDKVGELVDLDTTDKSNIVNAINEILNTASTTFEIHSGANNPNTTPPASYSIGDWYIRSGSSIYQFNGDAWILLSSSSTISDTESFLATEGQTVFTLSSAPVNVDVWVNDVYQQLTHAYTFSGNTVTLNDPINLNDRVVVRKYEQNISGAISKTPIQATYDDLDALVAAQGSQLQGYVYRVLDGSTVDASITGELWVNYLGTTEGNSDDYSWEPRTSGVGSGTVTSVAVSGSDGIEVDSGSPITTSGTIALGINASTLRSHINVEDGADVTDAANVNAAGAVMESDYDANTILAANADNTPLPLTVAEQTLVGRITAGNITALTATQIRTLLAYLEELIEGTATYNGATTGAANLDISAFSSHYAILTGNTTHTLTGLPASGKTIVKEWLVKSTTTESYAVANADKTIGSFVADGTINRVLASVSVFPTIGQFIVITYENLP